MASFDSHSLGGPKSSYRKNNDKHHATTSGKLHPYGRREYRTWQHKRASDPPYRKANPSKARNISFFIAEKKGGIKWLGRHIPSFLMSTSSGYTSSEDGEFEAAVAATAYAITMLEEYGLKSQRFGEGIEITSVKHKSRKEESTTRPTQFAAGVSRGHSQKASKEDKQPIGDLGTTSGSKLGGLSKIDSQKATKEDKQAAGDLSTTGLQPGRLLRRPSWKASQEKQSEEEAARTRPEIAPRASKPGSMRLTNPIVQKAPSFSGTKKDPNETSNIKPANAMAPEIVKKRNEMPYSGDKEQKAAAWEKAKLADVKKRYEKLLETIRLWEEEKKKKAKSRLEKRQGELERKRERAITEYRNQMNMINKIASGARFQAEEKRKIEEINAKKKASKIKLTGEFPRACFCF